MATTVTKVIDPDLGSGYDYDSLYDWEAAQQGDLTGARDEIAIAKCRCTGGTADTTAVTIDGWTTSATQYIKVWTDLSESYRHVGVWPTGNKYRLTGINFFIIAEENCEIIGLAIDATSVPIYSIGSFSSGFLTISGCLLYGTSGDLDNGINVSSVPSSRTVKINNNIIKGFATGVYTDGPVIYCYNNTIISCTTGFIQYDGDIKLINNIFSGCTTAASGTFVAGSGYNATDLASMNYTVTGGATGDRVSQTFSFVGAADFHLKQNDTGALGYGTNLYNDANLAFQTDIDLHDRGGAQAAWDIGSDQWIPEDSVCWGHDTGVTQSNVRNFSGKWYGTGEVLSTGDGERIELASGEYMISEIISVPADSTVTLRKNSYFARA